MISFVDDVQFSVVFEGDERILIDCVVPVIVVDGGHILSILCFIDDLEIVGTMVELDRRTDDFGDSIDIHTESQTIKIADGWKLCVGVSSDFHNRVRIIGFRNDVIPFSTMEKLVS